MKFLFISPRYSGGMGGHATILAEQLTKNGHHVDKLQVPHIPIKNLKNPSFVLFSIFKAKLMKNEYDVVHGFNIPSAFAMQHVRAKKKVLSVHGVFSDQISMLHSRPLGSLAGTAEMKALKLADALTTDSKTTQKLYKEKLGLNFEYLPTAIDTSRFKEIPDVQKIENQIVYIGRDSHEKGIDVLREAEPKINGTVVYCTDKPWADTMKVLKSSNILVVPSRIESMPTNIKEAFYLQIPVVATNVGGTPELIANGSTGILIPPNDPTLLAESVNNLLKEKKLQESLTRAAYDYIIKNMTWDVWLPKYVEFYEKLA